MTDWTRNRNRSNRRRKIADSKYGEINGAPAENCSGPENRDASISSCKPIANAIEISIVFEHLDRSTHRMVAAFRTSSLNLPSSALTWNRLPGVDGVWIAENGAVDSSSGQLRRVPKGAGKSVRGPRDLKREY